jgi:P22 coat protein - gene protein 5
VPLTYPAGTPYTGKENTILTPTAIAKRALATLYRDTVLSQLVHRDYESEFAAKVGDTITIRQPPTFVANEFDRTTGVAVQASVESGIPMTLNHFKDVTFAVTPEEMALKIDEFAPRFIEPAVQAIVQAIESDLLALRSSIPTFVGSPLGAGEDWKMPEALIAARRELSKRAVPMTNRFAVVGAITAGEWLKQDLLKKADARGDTQGLREASLGNRLFGFDVYEHNGIVLPPQTTGNSTTEVGLAFHRDALALAIRPLQVPLGANDRSSVATHNGFGMRVTYGYDLRYKIDMVSMDILYGMKVIDPTRAILIRGPLVP